MRVETGRQAIVDNVLASMVPVVYTRTSGDINTANVGFLTWTAIDAGGTPTARPMDLVIADARAGDWVTLSMSGVWASDTDGVQMSVATIVDGDIVNVLCGAVSYGVQSWGAPATSSAAIQRITGSYEYQIVSGDIESGSARFRAVYWAGAVRTLNASTSVPWQFSVKGPFR